MSRELETAKPNKCHGSEIPNGRKIKEETLSDAGIPVSTAHDCEQLTGGKGMRQKSVGSRSTVSVVPS